MNLELLEQIEGEAQKVLFEATVLSASDADRALARLVALLAGGLKELSMEVKAHQGGATVDPTLNQHHSHSLKF